MRAKSKALLIAQRLYDAKSVSGIMQRHFILLIEDSSKQKSSHLHFCQYLNSAKLCLAYLNERAEVGLSVAV